MFEVSGFLFVFESDCCYELPWFVGCCVSGVSLVVCGYAGFEVSCDTDVSFAWISNAFD